MTRNADFLCVFEEYMVPGLAGRAGDCGLSVCRLCALLPGKPEAYPTWRGMALQIR